MTGTLIALVDGSAYSKSVCDHAAWIAGRTGLGVELMHVLGRRETARAEDLSGSIALGARSALLAELSELDEQRSRLVVHRGRAILDDARAVLDAAGVAEARTHLRHGDLIEAVAEKEAGAEMFLIGKRGEGADFAKGHLGSNLDRVMRSTRKPLVVASRAFRPVRRALIAFAGSPSSLRAVDHVARSPLYAGLELCLVTVGQESDRVAKWHEDARAMLRAAGHEAGARVIPGQPEEALGALVESDGFDLVVMGASGHSRIRALFVGSTTLDMMRSCKVPIVAIR